MRRLSFLLFVLVSNFCLAQRDNLRSVDSLLFSPSNRDTIYIKDYSNQLNINFNVSNEYNSYFIPTTEGTGLLKPNINIRYAVDFNYKFLTIRLGVRPKFGEKTANEKGESEYFRFRLQFTFINWAHVWEYNRTKGYYLSNSDSFISTPADARLQFPNLTTHIFMGQTYRKLNSKYSIQAIQSQTTAQLKSAGTWMPSINYWVYSYDGFGNYLDVDGNNSQRQEYNALNGFSIMPYMGYHYTFVVKKFYFNSYIDAGMGYDYTYIKKYNEEGLNNSYVENDFIYSSKFGINLGYNSKTFFAGASTNSRLISYGRDRNGENRVAKNIAFNVFIGYRFRPPKAVRNTVDKIGDKIPLISN